MIWLVGLGPFLLVHLPITLLAGSIGVWLFYVQHQFEDTFWTHDEGWNFHEAALRGSSHYGCQTSCAGLPPISGCTMSTISVAVSHITDCHECYGITQSLLPSGDLRSLRASVACAWFFGTKGGGGSFPFAKCISSRRS